MMRNYLSKQAGILLVITAVIILALGAMTVSAQNPQKGDIVQIQLPAYAVQLNGQTYHNDGSQYPVIHYRGDTYIPLTWENMRYMGLKLRTFEGGISVCSSAITREEIENYSTQKADNSGELYACIPDGDYYFNLKKSDYGLLFFRDIYYISTMHGDILDAFGWEKMHDGKANILTVDSRNAVRPQNMDDGCINCELYRHGCKKYYMWKDGYVEYPSARQDDEPFGEFVWRLRGEEEKRCDFTSELSGVKYLDTVYADGTMALAPIMPCVHNGVFVILGAVYIPPAPGIGYTANVIIGIDLKESKLLMCSEYKQR